MLVRCPAMTRERLKTPVLSRLDSRSMDGGASIVIASLHPAMRLETAVREGALGLGLAFRAFLNAECNAIGRRLRPGFRAGPALSGSTKIDDVAHDRRLAPHHFLRKASIETTLAGSAFSTAFGTAAGAAGASAGLLGAVAFVADAAP